MYIDIYLSSKLENFRGNWETILEAFGIIKLDFLEDSCRVLSILLKNSIA